ncbi:MAG: hypothetical protein WAN36_10190, partial [Calditrichia bacterium]
MRIFTALILLQLLSGWVHSKEFSAIRGNPYLLPGQELVDISAYEIDLDVSPDNQFIQGKMRISGTVINSAADRLVLNFYDHMQIDSVTDSQQNLNFTHANQVLTIPFAASLNPGENFDVNVYYRGYPMQGSTPGYGLLFTSYAGQKLVYSYNWPYFASTFLPCKDHPSDKADSVSISLTVPDSYKTACNGALTDSLLLPGGRIRYNWKTRYPLTTYGISLNIYPFHHRQDIFE